MTMISSKFRSTALKMLIFGTAASLALQACKSTPKANPDNVVNVPLLSEPSSLNPVLLLSSGMLFVSEYTQRTPTRIDLRTLKQIPMLVKALPKPSADGLSYTMDLRNDVKWDDGSPLTTDDIIFTMLVSKCPGIGNPDRKSAFENVKEIVKNSTDPQQFTVVTSKVHYLNQNVLDNMHVIQKKMWDPKGVFSKITFDALSKPDFNAAQYPGLTEWISDFNNSGHDLKRVNGLGPYSVTEWKAGSYIVLSRKKDWWGANDTSVYSKAYPERIVFSIDKDENTMMVKMKNGKLDVNNAISTAAFLKLKADTAFANTHYMGMTDLFQPNVLAMNTKPEEHTPFFADKRVRRAMALLTPIDDINRDNAKGNGVRQASFVQPIMKEYYNESLQLLPLDVEQAKKLLDEAGWTDTDGDNIRDKTINGKKVPFSFELSFGNTQKVNENIAMELKQAYAKAGIELKLHPEDLATMGQELSAHKFDMILYALSGSSTLDDPAQLFSQKSWSDRGSNITGFGNMESDKLIDQIDREMDESKRIPLVKKLQAMVYDEQPYIYLYAVKRKIIISKRFNNPGMYAERPGVILSNLKLKE